MGLPIDLGIKYVVKSSELLVLKIYCRAAKLNEEEKTSSTLELALSSQFSFIRNLRTRTSDYSLYFL